MPYARTAAAAAKAIAAKGKKVPMSSISSKIKAILPEPFDWCEIPTGKVASHLKATVEIGPHHNLYGPGELKSHEVQAFLMAKYPVTNAQYQVFMDAGGYRNPLWWTKEGWLENANRRWQEPRYWQDRTLNAPEQPVVGISWYEAIAFCLWLSDATGEAIMLPTELQWERAARGDDGRIYPWGNRWDEDRCNFYKQSGQKPTPVRSYEGKGDSPFQVVDMIGNVFQWTLTEFETGNMRAGNIFIRAHRGGSYLKKAGEFDIEHRRMWFLYDTFQDCGFRISCS